jgi:hypothetical protein
MRKSLSLGLGLVFLSSAALAQPQCDTLLSTNEGTTWSIIVTAPDGKSCLVAAGEGWRALEQVALDPET